MTHDRLVAIEDRLFRADENLDVLKDYLRAYHASDAYRVTGEFDPDDERGIHILGAVAPPPIRVFTLTGDLLHEWRSALCQLAWQLVRINGGEPGDSTDWPILTVAPTPFKRGPNRGKHPHPNTEGGLSDTARAILEETQPYLWGDAYMVHPLFMLDHLNILDKHRHIAIRGVHLSNVVVAAGSPVYPFTFQVRTLTSSEHGAEVEFVPNDAEVDVHISAVMQVSVHEPTGGINRPLFETLTQIRMSVWTTFLDIERECFGAPHRTPPGAPSA